MTQTYGASRAEWTAAHMLAPFDLLPVVSNPATPISAMSHMKSTGKTPSVYNREGFVVGIPKWTEMQATAADVARWQKQPDYGVCLQTRSVRAIDIDIDDPVIAKQIAQMVEMVLDEDVPVRFRSNSGKRLQLLRVQLPEGHPDLTKRIIRTAHGLIEFLATGQQALFGGTHPSGVRYEWAGGPPSEVPTVMLEEFETLWAMLVKKYAVDGKSETVGGAADVGERIAADADDPYVEQLVEKGWVLGQGKDGTLRVRCPNEGEHTSDNGPTQSVYFPAGLGGRAAPGYKCLHAHCTEIHGAKFLEMVGLVEPMKFRDVRTEEEAVTDAKGSAEIKVAVPKAKHPCTDLRNANRIIQQFGKRMIWTDAGWMVWDGRHWRSEEAPVYRYAGRLSEIIHAEANEMLRSPAKSQEEKEEQAAIAKALRAWAAKSEMKAHAEQAMGWVKKLMKLDTDRLDQDKYLLNCLNGTVDLRSGLLKPHDPDDYITKLVRVEYHPEVVAPIWQQIVERVYREEGAKHKPVSRFMQRWFGYCATADVREQKFVVHWGVGSNGKSTIIDTMARVLGPYAKAAAPGMLMSSANDRHATEIADLRGARMVTSSETGEGGVLREDFVKQATGGDRLKGRFMRENFFEFNPTHKLQLTTNHKPVIKGTDHGIWRRVLLVPYVAKWGDAEEVCDGVAHHLKDNATIEALMGESESQGILAWIVAGAVAWFKDGLNAPDYIKAVSREYKEEQDRVGQFVDECCELGLEHTEVLGGEWGGLYQAYRDWCKQGGMMPLSTLRFGQELEQKVPGFEKVTTQLGGRDEKRRKTFKIRGLRLISP